jgi:hypothetical protein
MTPALALYDGGSRPGHELGCYPIPRRSTTSGLTTRPRAGNEPAAAFYADGMEAMRRFEG